MSPFCFECGNCGKPLTEVTFQDYAKICHRTNSSKLSFLEYVIEQLGEKCPHCGKKLEIPPLEVNVKAPV